MAGASGLGASVAANPAALGGVGLALKVKNLKDTAQQATELAESAYNRDAVGVGAGLIELLGNVTPSRTGRPTPPGKPSTALGVHDGAGLPKPVKAEVDGGTRRLPPRGTAEREAIEKARRDGVRARQAQELADIRRGGIGSGIWTPAELKEIKRTGQFPADTYWHHNPTVANRPDLAGDPSVISPGRGGRKSHLQEHDGDWRLPWE